MATARTFCSTDSIKKCYSKKKRKPTEPTTKDSVASLMTGESEPTATSALISESKPMDKPATTQSVAIPSVATVPSVAATTPCITQSPPVEKTSQWIADWHTKRSGPPGVILSVCSPGLNGEPEYRFIKDGVFVSGTKILEYLNDQYAQALALSKADSKDVKLLDTAVSPIPNTKEVEKSVYPYDKNRLLAIARQVKFWEWTCTCETNQPDPTCWECKLGYRLHWCCGRVDDHDDACDFRDEKHEALDVGELICRNLLPLAPPS